jgi:CubicO group peptidase (beta-lactamase class C family)
VVRAGSPPLCRAYGFACVTPATAATPSTPFFTASVSKPVVAAVIAALAEREMVSLDADVGSYLPWPFRNPMHPEVPITLRMLLQHRASLVDDESWPGGACRTGDHRVSLSEGLSAYFSLDGAKGPRGHGTELPGSTVCYSSVGYALSAWIAERAARMPFDDLAQALLLRPLAMHHSSFRLRDVLEAGPAVPYAGPAGSALRPVRHYGFALYPAGTLRASVEDLARFVRCLLEDGTLDGVRVLSPATVNVLLPQTGPGLGWARFPGKAPSVRGHEGHCLGAGSRLALDLERRSAVVLLGNAEWTLSDERFQAVEPLESAAFALADGR